MAQETHSTHEHNEDHGVTETLKSLIMAFVLAMTFRGFVTEGFVIPTGSMAPTLMGQHALIDSTATGSSFRVGMDPGPGQLNYDAVADPMLGPDYRGWGTTQHTKGRRMGDRILVLKTLYPFFGPQRFDVVVFKNPTLPFGDSANYIKRLIGLPDEKIWLTDGDVFAGPSDSPETLDDYRIQRKPEHVQRAVWQSVHHSDYLPLGTKKLDWQYEGPPWIGANWLTKDVRVYRCDTSDPSVLQWSNDLREINDWTAYNQPLRSRWDPDAVSDLRVGAGIIPDQDGLQTRMELITRGHVYEYLIADGSATVRMRPLDDPDNWMSDSNSIDLPEAGEVYDVEFWHVDQALSIFLNGDRVAYLEYDWLPMDRLRLATGFTNGESVERLVRQPTNPPEISWHFEGSPVSLQRVRLDRDLHYRTRNVLIDQQFQNESAPEFAHLTRQGSAGIATHPNKPVVLGPDHFFMLGDNSARSLDGRIWGPPDPFVAAQIDPAPFVVHRKLLIGKAWVVYFPAMYPLTEDGKAVVPDFGRMRFIR